MNNRHIILALVIIAVIAAIYVIQTNDRTSSERLTIVFSNDTPINDFVPQFIYTPNIDKIESSNYELAPDLTRISGYINSQPFNLSQLRGQVVLIDFWTYTCINCIRTQPFLNAWYERYADEGLVIVGVHTPEFEFEKDYKNVEDAVQKGGLMYPVVQDNDYGTWRAFNNRFWPRKYLIDVDGLIRYDHAGEGAYEETESVIRQLLQERTDKLGLAELDEEMSSPADSPDVDFNQIGSPEMYFGYRFDRGHLGNPEGLRPEEIVSYTLPDTLDVNRPYLEGDWLVKPGYSELISETGTIVLAYSSKKVNIVASSSRETEINIFLDGELINEENMGSDGSIVNEETLYNIIDASYGQHVLGIEIPQPGFRIYTFTFG